MALDEGAIGSATRTHSNAVSNAKLGILPARLYTVEGQLGEGFGNGISVTFNVVAREGAFTDTTQANYNIWGHNSSILRTVATQIDARAPSALRGELTSHFEYVSPKTLNFEIIFRVEKDYSATDMKRDIMSLQALCYPRLVVAANPPLCMLHVLDLDNLEGYVTEVQIS